MNAATITETIAEHWEALEVLPTVREHQARVAGIVCVLRDHWKPDAPPVNWDEAILAALCHDLGNIAKVDLRSKLSQQLLGPLECERLEHWLAVQAKQTAAYGADEYAVTRGLLVQLIADSILRERIWTILIGTPFRYNNELAVSTNWEQVVVAYADRRTGPYAVLTLAERTAEGAKRYGYTLNPESEMLVQSAYTIEARIQENCNIPLQAITETMVAPYAQRFLALRD